MTSEELYFDNTAKWNNPECKYIYGNIVLADSRVLIGEDTSTHENNTLYICSKQ